MRRIHKLLTMMSGGGVVYLLRATFSTDMAAPLPSPLPCDIGELTITDTTNNLSISGGKLNLAAGAASGKAISAAFARKAGRAVIQKIKSTTGITDIRVGWRPDVNSRGFYTVSTGALHVEQFGLSVYAPGANEREYAAVMQSAFHYFLSRDLAGTWRLDWVTLADTGTETVGVYQHSPGATGTVDDLRVTDLPGAWSVDYGIATSRNATPGDGATALAAANCVIEFTHVAQAGVTQSFWFRRTTDDETWRIDCDQAGGTIKLYKRTGGVDTEVDAGKTQTWVAGNSYRLFVTADGTSIKTYVDATAKHGATDAFNQTATGVKISHAGSNLVCYPRYPTFPDV